MWAAIAPRFIELWDGSGAAVGCDGLSGACAGFGLMRRVDVGREAVFRLLRTGATVVCKQRRHIGLCALEIALYLTDGVL